MASVEVETIHKLYVLVAPFLYSKKLYYMSGRFKLAKIFHVYKYSTSTDNVTINYIPCGTS